jgi:chemotaxis signal transduction protein
MTIQPELGLSQLLNLINDELTEALHVQSDDTLSVKKIVEREAIGRHICIELAGRQLAIPLSAVVEAGELHRVRSLPLLPEWLAGITNIRGDILSVVNLAFFLGFTNISPAKEGLFLLVRDDTLKVVITVDRVVGTRPLYRCPSVVQKAQNDEKNVFPQFSKEMACYEEQGSERMIALFDLNAFLSSQKLRNVATV